MKIREATINDIPFILKVGKKTKEFQVDPKIKGFWSKKQLLNWIKSKKDVFLVAEEDKKIIGFVMFAHHVPTGKVTYENAWTDSKYRKKRVATKLTKEGLKKLKKMGATYICSLTKTDAISSIKFQEKNKFQKGYKFWWLHKAI